MKVRKLVALGLSVGVVFGSFGVAEAAKKKKKPKPAPVPVQADQQYYMRRDACGEDADNARLSLTDGPDEGNLCGWLDNGLINEAVVATDQGAPASDAWPVADGLPLTLDTSKPISGTINMVSSRLNAAPDQGAAAGIVDLIIDITGVSGGEEVIVGTVTVSYEVTPAASQYEVPFELAVDAALDKKVFEEFTMTTTVMGANAGHGLYELDNPASTVTIPAWVTAG